MQDAEHLANYLPGGMTMTHEELETQLQSWAKAYGDQMAIIKEHQAKADYCEFKIIQIRQRIAELEQAWLTSP